MVDMLTTEEAWTYFGNPMDDAIKAARPDLVVWLRDMGCPVPQDAISTALFPKRAERTLRALVSNEMFVYIPTDGDLDMAATVGDRTCMDYIIGTGVAPTLKTMKRAAGNGHVDIVLWLHETHGVPFSVKVTSRAAAHGSLDALRKLLAGGCPLDVQKAGVEAARNRKLDMVIYLHREHGMQLDKRVVGLLHFISGSRVLEYLDITLGRQEFLLTLNPPEYGGISKSGWMWCVSNMIEARDIEKLKWLWERDFIGTRTHKLAVEVARSGNLEILRWLHSVGYPIGTECIKVASERRHRHVIAWLQGVIETLR